MAENEVQAITVDIYDQTYRLRGSDHAYVEKLAALVDTKMRAVAAQGRTADSLRVAVLAALHLADEIFTLRARQQQLESEIRERAERALARVDQALENSA
jgi:cell division protein ZapA